MNRNLKAIHWMNCILSWRDNATWIDKNIGKIEIRDTTIKSIRWLVNWYTNNNHLGTFRILFLALYLFVLGTEKYSNSIFASHSFEIRSTWLMASKVSKRKTRNEICIFGLFPCIECKRSNSNCHHRCCRSNRLFINLSNLQWWCLRKRSSLFSVLYIDWWILVSLECHPSSFGYYSNDGCATRCGYGNWRYEFTIGQR